MNIPNTSNAEITSDIYLPGNLSQDNKIYLPLSSSAIVFVVQYCCTSKFKVFFTNRPTSNEYRVQLPSSILGTLAHSFVEYTEVPSLVQNCHLPVVHDKRDNLIRSGLCSAVRHIVQAANDEQPNAKFSELLVSDAISYSLSESSWFETSHSQKFYIISVLYIQMRDTFTAVSSFEEFHSTSCYFFCHQIPLHFVILSIGLANVRAQ